VVIVDSALRSDRSSGLGRRRSHRPPDFGRRPNHSLPNPAIVELGFVYDPIDTHSGSLSEERPGNASTMSMARSYDHLHRRLDGNDRTAVNAALNATIDQAAYRAEFDIDRSGTITTADRTIASTTRSALAGGLISNAATGGPDNPIGWDGYVFNAETRLYTVRHRTYEPALGRWMERDPAGTVDGLNLYACVDDNPVNLLDPAGQQSAFPEGAWETIGEWICWTRNNAVGANVLLQLKQNGIDGSDDWGGGIAFRHCLATCQSAKVCGRRCAVEFWDGREFTARPPAGLEKPGRPAHDQDLANNQVGYGCAEASSCWDCCMHAWKTGKLICRVTDLTDPEKRGPCPPPRSLPPRRPKPASPVVPRWPPPC
jgi:RHS repeat-associated protein